MRNHLIGALVLGLGVTCPAAAQQVSFERSFTTADGAKLEISTLGGKIALHSGPPGQVMVRGTATVRVAFDTPANAIELAKQIAAKPPIEQIGNVIRLQPPADPAQRRAATVAYDVVLPPGTMVNARSNSGDIIAADLSAASILETQSGKIDVMMSTGDLDVTTGSGAVTVRGASAGLQVRSGSSAIGIRDAGGAVNVKTQSGAVTIDVAPTAEVNVETGSSEIVVDGAHRTLAARSQSGAIRVTGRAGGAWNIVNGSGRVELTVNQGDGAQFDLSNRSGTISVPDSIVTTSATKRRVEAKLGTGEHPVTVDAGSGAITLHVVR